MLPGETLELHTASDDPTPFRCLGMQRREDDRARHHGCIAPTTAITPIIGYITAEEARCEDHINQQEWQKPGGVKAILPPIKVERNVNFVQRWHEPAIKPVRWKFGARNECGCQKNQLHVVVERQP